MHNHKIRYLLMVSAGGLLGLLSVTNIVRAETYIEDGYLRNHTTWTVQNSPYIIEDPITVPYDITLTIQAGVSVLASSSISSYNMFNVDGRLFLVGLEESPISISGDSGINISSGHIESRYTNFSLRDGISINYGTANISSSTISNANVGITAKSSTVSIKNSKISDNKQGIVVEDSGAGGIFQVKNDDTDLAIGGIGNMYLTQSGGDPSKVTISNSSIVNNSAQAIENKDISYVRASNNWWGSPSGISIFGTTNRVEGLVTYAPWLKRDPLIPFDNTCCSNILFIPGLQGTRLYKDGKSLIGTKNTNQLWEPNRNADVEKMYLDSTGASIDSGIYSGQPIENALGIKDVYGKFISYLDNKKDNNIINNWKAFGYDWRKPINEVVAGQNNKATTTESLLDVVYNLASSSKTSKVTIVAHSNGGLVAKYLVKVLTDLDKADLVDSIISVAVPYIGTPQAIGGLLHGADQSIAGGLILNQSTARGLGINMPSAYSLLPSKEYFSKVFGPTIAFASTTIKGVNDGSYPQNISSYQDQESFLVDTKNARISPIQTDTSLPIKGNKSLLLASDIIHSILDPFSWPATISKWSILGWGKDTTKGILYSEKEKCHNSSCNIEAVFKTETTKMGDGTVVAPSATYNSGTAVSLDLDNISKQEKRQIAHANILGASSTLSAIDDIIVRNPADDEKVIIEKLSKIPGVTIGEPDYTKEKVSLVLSTHSPVELHVYDSEGNHTGLIPKPIGLEDVEDGLYTFYDNDIIGSSFKVIQDNFGSNESYVYLPDDNGMNYTAVIKGNDFGEFTYKITRVREGKELDTVEYSNIPVTPLTVVTTAVQSRISEDSLIPVLASSSPEIKIDFDGNGLVDLVATSTTNIDQLEYHELLRTIIKSLITDPKRSKEILKKIDKLDILLKDSKETQIAKFASKINKKIGHKKFSGLSVSDRELIVQAILDYIKQYSKI